MLESVLIAEESIITYRRRYATRASEPAVVDLLVSDRTNPRSLGYQLQHLAVDLQGVPSRRSVEPISGVLASLERELDAIDVAMSDPDAGASADRPSAPWSGRPAASVGWPTRCSPSTASRHRPGAAWTSPSRARP